MRAQGQPSGSSGGRARRRCAVLVVALVALAVGSGTAIADDPVWGPVERVANDVVAAQIGPLVHVRDGTTLALWTSRNGRLSAALRSSDGVGWGEATAVSEPGVRVLSHTAVELPARVRVSSVGTMPRTDLLHRAALVRARRNLGRA